MKRAILIAGGTVGSLGAVLSITPPTFTSTESASGIGGSTFVPATETATTTPTATQTPTATPAPTKTATEDKSAAPAQQSTATKSANSTSTKSAAPAATPTPTKTATPTPTPTPTPTNSATTSGKATSGTFLGDPSTMRYGTVQVKIVISGGKIVDAVAVQAPSGRDQRYTDMAVPVMRQKTLAAQSANISGVSGASYTAYAWWVSLQSALSKAGWM